MRLGFHYPLDWFLTIFILQTTYTCSFVPRQSTYLDLSDNDNLVIGRFHHPSSCRSMSSTMGTEERTDSTSNPNANAPIWCPEKQIYVGGVIPENEQVKALLAKDDGYLRLFGYGSLCWNPGTGALAKPGIVATIGKARGYKRCWAQKSTDHRGTPSFPGVVCTLLKDSEVLAIRRDGSSSDHRSAEVSSMTEGVIYTIPPELVGECLEELDFREKGGYARDVIDVVEDKTGDLHQALLYRGTPDNPAFWPRALRDLPFTAGTFLH